MTRSPKTPTLLLRAAMLMLAALSAFAQQPPAGEPILGDAPIRHEPQDTAGWSFTLKAGTPKTRDQVVQLYNGTYLPGNAVAMGWTGSVAGCVPGTTALAHRQAVIDRVNYYRALVDVPAVALIAGTPLDNVQAAALIMSANNALSHTPPSTWTCYSAAGYNGASSSNLCLNCAGVAAIDLYMDDSGAGNSAVGHRRWLLFPPRIEMTTGDVGGDYYAPPHPANSLYVFGAQGTRPATPNGIAWPPAGFVPYQNLPGYSNRWSISYPGANFAGATVTMSGPSGPIPIAGYEPIANGYGDNTLVFLPTGFPYGKPAADTTYTVTVSGITGTGVPGTIQYTVTVIDPAAAPPGPCTYAVSPTDLPNVAAAGASPVITVTAGAGCPVTANSFQPWVQVTSITPNGSTTSVQLQIAANAGPARATTIVVAERLFLITQLAGP